MDREHHLKRLGFRAWHRGTREADYMIGGFFDRYAAEWSDEEVAWFERLIEQEDVDIMAWAMGKEPVPAAFDGPLMRTMQKLDYISIH
ncbi:FAD assembly factor SdhE [Sphingomonas sp. PR090111-T3T-6A]|uniref:FAD assembly factor SdhE n=1 Tax=Sphingomonas sp. PR090111-T3T-6A TaxID=685778 RepID=UPI0003747E55|nr:succinate dehydrogenase assembly factor 2 [Sphingomonas sp. PR090111-T3T-6A]